MDHIRGETGCDHVNIIGDTADDITRLVAVKVADRKLHEFVENIPSHVFGHLAADSGHGNRDDEGEDIGADICRQHQQRIVLYHGHIHMARTKPVSFFGDTDRLSGETGSEKISEVA